MIHLKLLELIWQDFPNFDANNNEDIIKAEKILKLQSKLDNEISLNDIENCIQFLNQYNSLFMPLLKDDNIKAILKKDVEQFNGFPCDFITEENETITEQFGKLFAEDIYGFISKCLKENAFFILDDLFNFYWAIINFEVVEKVKARISAQNKAVMALLIDPSKYHYLNTESTYGYAKKAAYYKLQSQVDSFFFEQDILTLTNLVARRHKANQMHWLGEILIALAGFESHNPDTLRLLDSNKEIGQSWMDIEEGTATDTSQYLVYFIIALVVVGFFIFLGVSSKIDVGASRLIIIPIMLIVRLINYFNKK